MHFISFFFVLSDIEGCDCNAGDRRTHSCIQWEGALHFIDAFLIISSALAALGGKIPLSGQRAQAGLKSYFDYEITNSLLLEQKWAASEEPVAGSKEEITYGGYRAPRLPCRRTGIYILESHDEVVFTAGCGFGLGDASCSI